MIGKELIGKGRKKVDAYMRKAGYWLYGYEKLDNGYRAEYYKIAAGITISSVFIEFTASWKVRAIS